jgi:hypothetical protein
LALEDHSQELDFPLQDASISQGIHSQFFEILILEYKQTVSFDRIISEVLNAIPETNLVEPSAYLGVAPLADFIVRQVLFLLRRAASM